MKKISEKIITSKEAYKLLSSDVRHSKWEIKNGRSTISTFDKLIEKIKGGNLNNSKN
jgi:hypothetical protein